LKRPVIPSSARTDKPSKQVVTNPTLNSKSMQQRRDPTAYPAYYLNGPTPTSSTGSSSSGRGSHHRGKSHSHHAQRPPQQLGGQMPFSTVPPPADVIPAAEFRRILIGEWLPRNPSQSPTVSESPDRARTLEAPANPQTAQSQAPSDAAAAPAQLVPPPQAKVPPQGACC
jgi:hypothetical protein